jgi:hypothetical protein
MKLVHLLLLGVYAQQDAPSEDPPSEESNKFIDKFGYDTRVTGMGSAEDAFDEYGAILNPFDLNQESLQNDNVVNLFYTFHSEDHDG